MKKISISLLLICTISSISVGCVALSTYDNLWLNGGKATFILHVRDDAGLPVEDAEAFASFWDPKRIHNTDTDSTDKEGNVELSGRAWTDGSFWISKEGYYSTKGRADFVLSRQEFERLGLKEWPVSEQNVELKKKRNPHPMIVLGRVELILPEDGSFVGVDLEKGDLVKPHGEGTQADLYVAVKTKEVPFGKRTRLHPLSVTLMCKGEGNGIQLCEADSYSEFRSDYQVDLTRPFQTRLSWEVKEDSFLGTKKYLTFRVRSVLDKNGKIVKANYGKIYFDLIYRNELQFDAIYFNPVPNDTNLEFDPERNLEPGERQAQRFRRRRVYRP